MRTYDGDNFDFPVLLVHALQFASKMQSAELIGQFVDFGAKCKQVFGLLWAVKGMGSASSGPKASGFELLGFLNKSLRVCGMGQYGFHGLLASRKRSYVCSFKFKAWA